MGRGEGNREQSKCFSAGSGEQPQCTTSMSGRICGPVQIDSMEGRSWLKGLARMAGNRCRALGRVQIGFGSSRQCSFPFGEGSAEVSMEVGRGFEAKLRAAKQYYYTSKAWPEGVKSGSAGVEIEGQVVKGLLRRLVGEGCGLGRLRRLSRCRHRKACRA